MLPWQTNLQFRLLKKSAQTGRPVQKSFTGLVGLTVSAAVPPPFGYRELLDMIRPLRWQPRSACKQRSKEKFRPWEQPRCQYHLAGHEGAPVVTIDRALDHHRARMSGPPGHTGERLFSTNK
jgi:hypothetical protein